MAVRTVLKRASISLVSTVAIAALLEFSLRAADYWYPPKDEPIAIWNRVEDQDMRLGRGLHQSVARLLWTPRPEADVPWGRDEKINAAGFRGPMRPPEKRPGSLRIVTLGDSSTFGHSVPYEATYSAQLEAILRERGHDVEVLDFGVVGYSIRQGLERYRLMARDWRPDVVVEAFGAVNDHIQAHLDIPDKDKIENEMAVSGYWGGIALIVRRDYRLMHLMARGVDALRGVTKDQRNQTFQQVRKHERQRMYMGAVEWRGVRRVPLEDFDATLLALQEAVEADGASLVALSMPRKRKVEKDSPVLLQYTDLIARLANERGLPLVDGRAAFRAIFDKGAKEEQLFADNYHPKPKGHRILAMSLAQAIEPLLAGE